jgi:hypothetical protein
MSPGRLAGALRRRLPGGGGETEVTCRDDQIVWIVGAPRSGTTWLLYLLEREPAVKHMDEPLIGLHLAPWSAEVVHAPFVDFGRDRQLFNDLMAEASMTHHFFAEAFRESWAPHLRAMILSRFAAHLKSLGTQPGEHPLLCVKDPNGAQGAGIVLSVLPGARVLHVVRDPRDVVVSHLAAFSDHSWLGRQFRVRLGANTREERIEEFAVKWRLRQAVAMEAYERQDPALRLRLYYEEMRADPEPQFTRLFEWLGLPTTRLSEHVSKLSFENVAKTGEHEFHRKAQPGEWREALSEAEQEQVVSLCADEMQALGYER